MMTSTCRRTAPTAPPSWCALAPPTKCLRACSGWWWTAGIPPHSLAFFELRAQDLIGRCWVVVRCWMSSSSASCAWPLRRTRSSTCPTSRTASRPCAPSTATVSQSVRFGVLLVARPSYKSICLETSITKIENIAAPKVLKTITFLLSYISEIFTIGN